MIICLSISSARTSIVLNTAVNHTWVWGGGGGGGLSERFFSWQTFQTDNCVYDRKMKVLRTNSAQSSVKDTEESRHCD